MISSTTLYNLNNKLRVAMNSKAKCWMWTLCWSNVRGWHKGKGRGSQQQNLNADSSLSLSIFEMLLLEWYYERDLCLVMLTSGDFRNNQHSISCRLFLYEKNSKKKKDNISIYQLTKEFYSGTLRCHEHVFDDLLDFLSSRD